MDELTINNGVEEQDAFDSGWDDDSSDVSAFYEPTEESEEAETEEADQPEEEAEAQEEPENEADEPDKAEDSYTLKHMDETVTVGRDEVIVYAQKGMDYDRIRQERDELRSTAEPMKKENEKLKGYADFLSRLAEGSHRTVEQLIDETEIQMLMAEKKGKGVDLTEEAAREELTFRREKAAFEAEKASLKAKNEKPEGSELEETDPATEKNKKEFLEFGQMYPDVKPEDIPIEVWNDFNKGSGLTSAYAKYENKKLREKITILEQNQKNRERSTGSRRSSGSGKTADPFDEGWDAY